MYDHIQLKNKLVEAFGREPESLNDIAYAMIAVINQQPNGRKNVNANFRVLGFDWSLRRRLLIVNDDHEWHGRALEREKNQQVWSGSVWIRYDTTVKNGSNDPLKAALLYRNPIISLEKIEKQNNPWRDEVKAYRDVKMHYHFTKFKEPVCYGFRCSFFEEDFPNIADEISKQDMWGILTEKRTKDYSHTFSWTDPETRERDQMIIDAAKNIHLYA